MQTSFLLYGANGYTGKLIARMASDYGLTPILAGRSEEQLKSMSAETGYEYRVASLDDANAVDKILEGVTVVLHAAGPFSRTAKPMIEACLRKGVHYLDITGEIGVYEMAKRKYHEQALAKGLMLMPGVGFDVVPTDCMALHLKLRMPDATHLKLAFAGLGGGVSRGTATTAAMGLGEKSAVRKDGQISAVPLGHKGMYVDFGPKKLFVMSIPWGDISTAYTTTGIPNIETYMGMAPKMYKMLKFQFLFNWLLRTSFMREKQLKKIRQGPPGPTDEQRARSKSLVWGEVKNAKGDTLDARLQVPEGYTLTAITSLLITRKVLAGNFKAGYQTPAGCYGEQLILEVPGVEFV
jgi:short subunit dehydrogenase-like uncharacterized protein